MTGSAGSRFRGRADAGRRLATRLARYAAERPLVLALRQGGVVVGRAKVLDLLAEPFARPSGAIRS